MKIKNKIMFRRFFLSVITSFFFTSILLGQEISFYSFGNAYEYEIRLANEAFECISNQCFDQLSRTKFIDPNTRLDDGLKEYLDSLKTMTNLHYRILNRRVLYYDVDLPPLTFYGVYYFAETEEVFFQVKLTLSYQSGGLLKADEIALVQGDFFLTPEKFRYHYDAATGASNIPMMPPDLLPEKVIAMDLYKSSRINLCNSCEKKRVSKKEGQYWLNESFPYAFISELDHGLYLAQKEALYGVVNEANEILLPFEFEKIEAKTSGLFIVEKNGLQGVYNEKGEIVLPAIYKEIKVRLTHSVAGSLPTVFIVKKDNSYGVLSEKGRVIIPFQYDLIELFFSKIYRVKKKDKYGLASLKGRMLMELSSVNIDFESFEYSDRIINITNKKGELEMIRIVESDEEFQIEKVSPSLKE